MAGIEFRVARGDHLKVEDFVATQPAGLAGVQLEVTNLDRHVDLAIATAAAGFDVVIEPMTERLCHAGFNPARLPFGDLYPLDVATLASSAGDRAMVTEQVLAAQLPHATKVIPPHFFVESDEQLALNVALLRQAVAAIGADRDVRPILAISSAYFQRPGVAMAIAEHYQAAGVRMLELRISPIGGQDEGPLKIRRTFAALRQLSASGLDVLLGCSGIVGHAAVALGMASSFSVGVGYREKYDHKSAIASQLAISEADDGEYEEDAPSGPRGALAGVFIEAAQITVPRALARDFYANPVVRPQLRCTHPACAKSIDGPAVDPRAHYLHAQTAALASTLDRPSAWRPTLLKDRFVRAQEVRAQIWAQLPDDAVPPKARTLTSLIDEIDRGTRNALSA